MVVRAKYQPVLNLGEELGIKNGYVKETDGQLHIGGEAENQYHKNLLWDKIKEIGGENPRDLVADITVAQTDYFAKHTVEKGETLGKIAKHYYGDPMMYKEIYAANSDTLKSADLIFPGQELTLPMPDHA